MSHMDILVESEILEDVLTYVDNVNPNLCCCICRMAFIDPYTTSTCDHTFCFLCINQAIAIVPRCPIDRLPLSPTALRPSSTIVRQLVDELLVACPHAVSGCAATPERYMKEAHLRDDCQYVLQKCPGPGCEARVMRKDMAEHMRSRCGDAMVECDACGERVRRSEFVARHAEECLTAASSCPNCSISLSPSGLQPHLPLCPSVPVPCPHATMGCSSVHSRSALPEHLKTCPYEAMRGFFALYDRNLGELRQDNDRLRRRLMELEGRVSQCEEGGRDLERGVGRALGPWFDGVGGRREDLMVSWEDHQAPQLTFSPHLSRSGSPLPSYNRLWHEVDPPAAAHAAPIQSPQSPFAPRPMPNPYSFNAPPSHSPAYTTPAPLVPAVIPSSGGLNSALGSLHGGLVRLSAHVEAQSRRNEVRLQTESLTIREEVGELRSILHGLRLQVHSSLDRMQPANYTVSRLHNRSSSLAVPVPRPASPGTSATPVRLPSPTLSQSSSSRGALSETSFGEPRDPNDTSSMTVVRPDKPAGRAILGGRASAKGVHMHTVMKVDGKL